MPDLWIDISHWNSDLPKQPIDWTRAKAAGVTRCYIKASESNNFTDPRFISHRAGAKSVGIKFGCYLFFRGQANGKSQAARFVYVVGVDIGDLPPAVDVESGAPGVTKSTYTARLRECLLEVESLTGKHPVIYTSQNAWDNLTTKPAWASEYRYWLAAPDESLPPLPAGVADWWLHQFLWTGDVDGITGDVDVNRENGAPPTPPPDDTDVQAIRAHAVSILGLV